MKFKGLKKNDIFAINYLYPHVVSDEIQELCDSPCD